MSKPIMRRVNASGGYQLVGFNADGEFRYISRKGRKYVAECRRGDSVFAETADLSHERVEKLRQRIQAMKLKHVEKTLIVPNSTTVIDLESTLLTDSMASEVAILTDYYRALLKWNKVEANLVLRLVELERSLRAVSRTARESDDIYLSDASTDEYCRTSFGFYGLVKASTYNSAEYASVRILDIARELKKHELTSHLVSSVTLRTLLTCSLTAVPVKRKYKRLLNETKNHIHTTEMITV